MSGTVSSLDKKCAHKILSNYFQQSKKYSKNDKRLIINNLSYIISRNSHPKTTQDIEQYLKKMSSSLVFPDFSLKIPKAKKASPAVRALYRKFLTGKLNFKSLLNRAVLKALFVKNPQLLQEMRLVFQDLLNHLGTDASKIRQKDYKVFSSLVGNILSFLVYFDPADGEKLQIPQYVQGEWRILDYTFERIELTPECLGSPMVAFGLTPNDPKARPFLVFKGTTYPADDGFLLSLLSDINIGSSPGGYAFLLARKKIKSWLKRQPRRACIYGQSLGGVLALQTVNAFPKYIAKVSAFSPTALLSLSKKWQNCKKAPQVRVYDPKNDIVPLAGLKWHPNWRIYRIFSKKKYNFIDAHTQIHLAQRKVLLLKVNPKKDQAKPSRWIVASLHLLLSVPLFLLGIQLYAVYLLARRIGKRKSPS